MLVRQRRLLLAAFIAVIAASSGMWMRAAAEKRGPKNSHKGMSAMGHAAARARHVIETSAGRHTAKDFEQADVCVNQPDCGEDRTPPLDGPSATPAET